MNVFDRILGRRKRTSEAFTAALASEGAALAKHRERIAAADGAEQAALEAGDKPALKAAQDERRDAEADAKICEHTIRKLQEGLTEAQDRERREDLATRVARHRFDKAALGERVAGEYVEHATAIGALLSGLRASEKAEEQLSAEARELGERVDFGPHPEACRRQPGTWVGTWPREEGGVYQGPVEDAPRGMFRWEGDKPVPAREGVTVRYRPGYVPESLVKTVDLPALRYGEKDFYRAPEEVPPALPVAGMGRV
jgi:hypothetical protein